MNLHSFIQSINLAGSVLKIEILGPTGALESVYFQKPDDRALSVVRASKSYISMSLPVLTRSDCTTHGWVPFAAM